MGITNLHGCNLNFDIRIRGGLLNARLLIDSQGTCLFNMEPLEAESIPAMLEMLHQMQLSLQKINSSTVGEVQKEGC